MGAPAGTPRPAARPTPGPPATPASGTRAIPVWREVKGGQTLVCDEQQVLLVCEVGAVSHIRLLGVAPPLSWTPGSPRATEPGPALASPRAPAVLSSWAWTRPAGRGRRGGINQNLALK